MSGLSIKHVRTASGLSQTEFAELIGFSMDTVASVEQGRVGVSSKLARRVFIATGAIPTFLEMADSEGRAYAWTRERYAPEHFAAWKSITQGDILTATGGGLDNSRFQAVLDCHFAAAKVSGKLGKFQAALALAAFDLAFEMETANSARIIADKYGVSGDFSFLAEIAGRIEPERK